MIYKSPLPRFLRGHKMIPVERPLDLFVRTPAMSGVNLIQTSLRLDDVLRMPLDIRHLPLKATRGLMYENAGIR